MRKTLITLMTITLALLLAACGGETSDTTQAGSDTTSAPASTAAPDTTVAAAASPLAGEWERGESSSFSSLDGMIVGVNEEGTTAVIVSVPENEYQFVEGDEKWTAITPGEENEWTFQDLQRATGSGAESHVEGIIAISEDGGTITMTFPSTGTVQEWIRLGD